MSELKYKVGDKVRIKDIGWYNKYKDEDLDIPTYQRRGISIDKGTLGK